MTSPADLTSCGNILCRTLTAMEQTLIVTKLSGILASIKQSFYASATELARIFVSETDSSNSSVNVFVRVGNAMTSVLSAAGASMALTASSINLNGNASVASGNSLTCGGAVTVAGDATFQARVVHPAGQLIPLLALQSMAGTTASGSGSSPSAYALFTNGSFTAAATNAFVTVNFYASLTVAGSAALTLTDPSNNRVVTLDMCYVGTSATNGVLASSFTTTPGLTYRLGVKVNSAGGLLTGTYNYSVTVCSCNVNQW